MNCQIWYLINLKMDRVMGLSKWFASGYRKKEKEKWICSGHTTIFSPLVYNPRGTG
jgi:hypothetical protein